ncbi:MAG: glycosyltransferase [Muribaculaceae bacterium]|nr:glycosyltransferase [Muribaculaceae bacterium]
MRLLIVIPHFLTGGAQRLLGDLLPLMAMRDDMDITLALYADPGRSPLFAPLQRNPHIKVRILGLPLSYASYFNPIIRFKAVRKLRNLMKEADVCHVHLFPALYDASIAARGLPLRLIFTNHNTTNRRRHFPLIAALERLIYARYNTIAGISPASVRALIEWLKADPADPRFHVVRNGIVTEDFSYGTESEEENLPESESELIEIFNSGPDVFLRQRMNKAGIKNVEDVYGRPGHAILMISRFVANKDQASLIRALAILKRDSRYRERIPADTFLAFAGDGATIGYCRRVAGEEGVADDVVFLGERSDIPRLIASASAGAQISKWEGFGLTACEILAGGIPLVATDVSGMADIVRGAARLADKENPQSIAAALAAILAPESPDEVNDTLLMKAEGTRIAKRYHISGTLELYLQLYNK